MNQSWMKQEPPPDLALTADQVLNLPLGSRVCLNWTDEQGVPRIIFCIVAGHPNRKFLTYRSGGLIKHFQIKDYPNKYYTKVV